MRYLFLAALALSAAVATAGAEPSTAPTKAEPLTLDRLGFGREHGPVRVSADALEFDYRARRLTYAGNVLAEQGPTQLRSEKLTLTLSDAEPRRIETLVADGAVKLTQGARQAVADHAVFDDAKRTIVLRGNAVLRDGANQVSGERVTVFLDEQRSEVSGGNGRVSAVLYPDAEATPTEGGR